MILHNHCQSRHNKPGFKATTKITYSLTSVASALCPIISQCKTNTKTKPRYHIWHYRESVYVCSIVIVSIYTQWISKLYIIYTQWISIAFILTCIHLYTTVAQTSAYICKICRCLAYFRVNPSSFNHRVFPLSHLHSEGSVNTLPRQSLMGH